MANGEAVSELPDVAPLPLAGLRVLDRTLARAGPINDIAGVFADPPDVRRDAPELGEQSGEILAEAELAAEEIVALRAGGVVGGA